MTNLKHYLQDGANYQARAVLMMLQHFELEADMDTIDKEYIYPIKVARWENCREQGYVVMLKARNGKNINIAFFEHRNTDGISAVKWEQPTYPNSPTIDTALPHMGEYADNKYATSFGVSYGNILEMAEWIGEQLQAWWDENNDTKEAK